MTEDLYDDSPSDSGKSHDAPKKDSGKQTALLDSSICPGMKPGDKLMLTIEATHDKEYTVSYDEGDESKESKPDKGSEMKSMQEEPAMASMDSNYD